MPGPERADDQVQEPEDERHEAQRTEQGRYAGHASPGLAQRHRTDSTAAFVSSRKLPIITAK